MAGFRKTGVERVIGLGLLMYHWKIFWPYVADACAGMGIFAAD